VWSFNTSDQSCGTFFFHLVRTASLVLFGRCSQWPAQLFLDFLQHLKCPHGICRHGIYVLRCQSQSCLVSAVLSFIRGIIPPRCLVQKRPLCVKNAPPGARRSSHNTSFTNRLSFRTPAHHYIPTQFSIVMATFFSAGGTTSSSLPPFNVGSSSIEALMI